MVVGKGIFALLLQALGVGFYHGVVRWGKGQFDDDDLLQRIAWNIYPFPKRG